ncbi:DUF1161 domain-containing protein [Solimicrobium silvestre]|nr:DUF1161 domain-containing protein [Solimicrobium silvestre]
MTYSIPRFSSNWMNARFFTLWIAALLGMSAVAYAEPTTNMEEQLSKFKRISYGLMEFSRYKVAVTEFFLVNAKFPSSNKQIGMPAAEKFRSDMIDSVNIESEGVIAINFLDFPTIPHAWIHLVPAVTETGQMHWHCVSNIPDIGRTAPDCDYDQNPLQTAVNSEADASIKATPALMSNLVIKSAIPEELNASASILSCAALQHTIEEKLLAKGIKNFKLNIVEKSHSSTAMNVGRCDGGKRKIIYLKNFRVE